MKHKTHVAFAVLVISMLACSINISINSEPAQAPTITPTVPMTATPLAPIMTMTPKLVESVEIGRLIVTDPTDNIDIHISYNAPENGRLIFVMNNPDSSRDGDFKVEIPGTGEPAYEIQNFRTIPTYAHLESVFDCSGSVGLAGSSISLDVDRGPIDMRLSYGSACGLDNTGTNTLIVYFGPAPLSERMLLKTFTVSPKEQSSISIEVAGPGEIIVDATEVGTFGGGDFVYYLDGNAIGSTQLYTNGFYATKPFIVTIPLGEARRYIFALSHEDGIWDDNQGRREAKIFFRK